MVSSLDGGLGIIVVRSHLHIRGSCCDMAPIEAMVDPSSSPLSRGLALERAGRYSEAVAAYRQAAQVDPSDAEAQVHLGVVLRELGRDEEANEAFRAALELHAEAV